MPKRDIWQHGAKKTYGQRQLWQVAELEERHVVGQAALEALGDAAQRLEGGNVRFARRRSSPTRLMVAGGRDSTWLSIRRAWLCGIAHNWYIPNY